MIESIGEIIKNNRIKLYLSQEDVAKELGCSQQMVVTIEKGKSFGKYLFRYLVLLKTKGVSLDKIFDSLISNG